MRYPNKWLVAGLIGLSTSSIVFAQTSSTAAGSQQGSAPNATTSEQQLNSALAARLYGGLNATALGGQLPIAPGIGVVGGTTATPGNATNGLSAATTQAVNTPGPGTLPSQAGAFQPGAGYTNGINAARPGTVGQGMGPASITTAQQTNNALLGQTGLNNNGARTAAPGTAPASGTFNMGTGVPGTGMATPGTITQGSGTFAAQPGQSDMNFGLANRLYGGLGYGQSAFQGSAIPESSGTAVTGQPSTLPGAVGTVNNMTGTTRGVQGMGQPAQGTGVGSRTGVNGGLRTSTPPGGLRPVTPSGAPVQAPATAGSPGTASTPGSR